MLWALKVVLHDVFKSGLRVKEFPTKNEMSYVLNKLNTKKDLDNAIKSCEDKVLVLRFGRDADTVCQQLDDIVRKCDPLQQYP